MVVKILTYIHLTPTPCRCRISSTISLACILHPPSFILHSLSFDIIIRAIWDAPFTLPPMTSDTIAFAANEISNLSRHPDKHPCLCSLPAVAEDVTRAVRFFISLFEPMTSMTSMTPSHTSVNRGSCAFTIGLSSSKPK